MSKNYIWRERLHVVPESLIREFLDGEPRHKIKTSQLHRCQLCLTNIDSHSMRYRLSQCSASTCGDLGECARWLKVVICATTQLGSVYEHGSHLSAQPEANPNRMTLVLKHFTRNMAALGSKPMQIMSLLVDKFKLNDDTVPKLSQVQRVSYHHKKKVLMETALISEMVEMIQRRAFHAALDETTPFTFCFTEDESRIPTVGNGSDDSPFLIGMSTKRMIRSFRHATDYPLHIDATFKVNQQAYPMVVCGVSDATHGFHLGAVFVSSHLRQLQYATILSSVLDMYQTITGSPMVVSQVLGDADDAQYNGIEQVILRSTPGAGFFMCFFHVMMNVKKRADKMNQEDAKLVYRHVYRIHHARDETSLCLEINDALAAWHARAGLASFAVYFQKEWLCSRFWRWQCYHTPIGQAKTNNPAEQFNRAFKRDYTKNLLLPVNALMEKIELLCRTTSVVPKVFQTENVVTADLQRRHKYLAQTHLFSHYRIQAASMSFLTSSTTTESLVQVFQHGIEKQGKPLSKTDKKRIHALYLERFRQPRGGWVVDVQQRYCPCSWWFKFGFCVHLVEALKVMDLSTPSKKNQGTFVSRKPKRTRSPSYGETDEKEDEGVHQMVNMGGRPRRVGHALSFV